MKTYIYLSILPEAIIASMLPPKEFGEYLATGVRKKTSGQAIFIEIDSEMVSDILPREYISSKCKTKEDGTPKNSVYVSVYRAFESLKLKALKNLYLVTSDGKLLELEKDSYNKAQEKKGVLHLYQELSPVTPVIASTLTPSEYANAMTDEEQQIHVPKLLFVELILEDLAADPLYGAANNLPYPYIDHLRDCLMILKNEPGKTMKTVQRTFNGTLLYRTCTNGFFAATANELCYYPYPSMQQLELEHYDFWRSI